MPQPSVHSSEVGWAALYSSDEESDCNSPRSTCASPVPCDNNKRSPKHNYSQVGNDCGKSECEDDTQCESECKPESADCEDSTCDESATCNTVLSQWEANIRNLTRLYNSKYKRLCALKRCGAKGTPRYKLLKRELFKLQEEINCRVEKAQLITLEGAKINGNCSEASECGNQTRSCDSEKSEKSDKSEHVDCATTEHGSTHESSSTVSSKSSHSSKSSQSSKSSAESEETCGEASTSSPTASSGSGSARDSESGSESGSESDCSDSTASSDESIKHEKKHPQHNKNAYKKPVTKAASHKKHPAKPKRRINCRPKRKVISALEKSLLHSLFSKATEFLRADVCFTD